MNVVLVTLTGPKDQDSISSEALQKSSLSSVQTEWLAGILPLWTRERHPILQDQYLKEACHITMGCIWPPNFMLLRIPSVDLFLHVCTHMYNASMCIWAYTHTHTQSWTFTNYLLKAYVPTNKLVIPLEQRSLMGPSSRRKKQSSLLFI